MAGFVNYNGKLLHEDTPLVNAGNRGLRYGDGVFETMKVMERQINLRTYHFERLFKALALLRFELPEYFDPPFLEAQIVSLCEKNNLGKAARIRLNIFRKNGGLYDPVDHTPEFVIEAWELPEHYLTLNNHGLVVDIYHDAKKSCDLFSSIKTNNYLPYTMGALYAKEHKLNDCLVLNVHDRICDATIANVFWVRGQSIYTPPIAEGCIDGVMRRHLLDLLPKSGHIVEEKLLSIEELETADELFLTNATSGIRWVKEFGQQEFKKSVIDSVAALIF